MNSKESQVILYGIEPCSRVIQKILTDHHVDVESKLYFEIKLILTEALVNAFEHGNKSCVDQPIFLNYIWKRNSVIFKVQDKGSGFDYSAVPSCLDEENLMLDHGRGLFLIKKVSDRIEINGNTLVIEKKL